LCSPNLKLRELGTDALGVQRCYFTTARKGSMTLAPCGWEPILLALSRGINNPSGERSATVDPLVLGYPRPVWTAARVGGRGSAPTCASSVRHGNSLKLVRDDHSGNPALRKPSFSLRGPRDHATILSGQCRAW
jgi:hypothetical protein